MGRAAPPLPASEFPALAKLSAPFPLPDRPIRRWVVLHACEDAAAVLPVAAAQVEAGMRPAVMTADAILNLNAEGPQAWRRPDSNTRPMSLVHAWQEVRHWRNMIAGEAPGAEILHAHCFAAAMAGARGDSPVVYDFHAALGATRPLDDPSTRPGPWLLRSLRVAEQFALSRSAAVVVHSQRMASQALERGVRQEDLFLIPDPVDVGQRLPRHDFNTGKFATVVFAPAVAPGDAAFLLRAFALLAAETGGVAVLLEMDLAAAPRALVRQWEAQSSRLAALGCALHVISSADRERALAAADLVVVNDPEPGAEGPHAAAIAALAHGRALLACDVPLNREATPQGRGCLWFRAGDERDLAARAAFLARNVDFRRALASAGRAHIQATRARAVVAGRYDEAYRHAWQRHRGPGSPALRQLQTIRASY